MKISLCLIVWNELAGCKADVPRLPEGVFHEIFAVDGGSTDGTVEYLTEHGIAVHRQPKRSLNAAYHHAVEMASGDALVVFFPKATLDPICVKALADSLREGTELVIASRNIAGAANEEDAHWFRPRKWGVGALATFAAVMWRREGVVLHDVLHGVKGFTLDVFRRMRISEMGVSIDLEMVVRAYRLRARRREIPVQETARLEGTTHFKLLPTAKKLGKFLCDEMLHPPALS